MEGAIGFLLLVVGAYLAPGFVALFRSHRNTLAIFALNILLGWTALGWIVAFVWALTADRQTTPAHASQRLSRLPASKPRVRQARGTVPSKRAMAYWGAGLATAVAVLSLGIAAFDRNQTASSQLASAGNDYPPTGEAASRALRVGYHDVNNRGDTGNSGAKRPPLVCSRSASPMPSAVSPATFGQCQQAVREFTKAMIANIRVTATCWAEVAEHFGTGTPGTAAMSQSSQGLLKLIPALEAGADDVQRKTSTLGKCREQLSAAHELVRLQPELRGDWAAGARR